MMRIILEPAYVMHTRPYGETSLHIEFFSLNHGRVCAIARSARGIKSRFKGCFLPFVSLLISCQGRTELLQLTGAEINAPSSFLQGNILFNGMYLNELLIKLLPRLDAYPELFKCYQETLSKLQLDETKQQSILRIFEKKLLSELGYGLQLRDDVNGQPIDPEHNYLFNLEQGFVPDEGSHLERQLFKGSHLLAIQQNDYVQAEVLQTARRLMRLVMGHLLKGYQLRSRELYLGHRCAG